MWCVEVTFLKADGYTTLLLVLLLMSLRSKKRLFIGVSEKNIHDTSMAQFISGAQSCPTLCDLMNRSTPGLPVHHQLPEFTQTHVHRVGDAIQPSHPLSSPSPPALSLSQHQGLFKWVSSSHQVAEVLEFQLQHQSFQWIPRSDHLYLITWTTILSNSVRLSHAVWGHPRQMGHGGEVWQNVVHWRREWQTTSVFLPWEPHEQCEKAKR